MARWVEWVVVTLDVFKAVVHQGIGIAQVEREAFLLKYQVVLKRMLARERQLVKRQLRVTRRGLPTCFSGKCAYQRQVVVEIGKTAAQAF